MTFKVILLKFSFKDLFYQNWLINECARTNLTKIPIPEVFFVWVISGEIITLAALYTALHNKIMLFRAWIPSFALDLHSQWSPEAICPYLRHLHPFLLYQSLKNMRGGGKRLLCVWFDEILPQYFLERKILILQNIPATTNLLYYFHIYIQISIDKVQNIFLCINSKIVNIMFYYYRKWEIRRKTKRRIWIKKTGKTKDILK